MISVSPTLETPMAAKPQKVWNPPNPWASNHVEWLGEPPEADLQVYEEQARSIVASNDSPDVPFNHGVNPYRGCFHGCAYCYARPTHQYLDFGAGSDFERKITVKTNAVELLYRELRKPGWEREPLAFSGVTDCYQPLEASYELTRGCLQVCRDVGNPVGVITKSSLIRRDIDVLAELSDGPGARVFVSIPFADDETGWAIEPHAAAISQRFKTLAALSDAGIETGVAIAPVIPALNDSQIPEILERARDAGATRSFMILLRLPLEVAPVFEKRLREAFPDRADRVMNSLRQMRSGRVSNPDFGDRMTGSGPQWEMIRSLYDIHSKRLGFVSRSEAERMKKAGPLQSSLF
jgi:DNA repair photolyase